MSSRILAIFVIALGLVAVSGEPMAAQGMSRPSIISFTASPKALTSAGGQVLLTASVKAATHCLFSSSVSTTDLPASVACGSGTATKAVTLPANFETSMAKTTFRLKATNTGGQAKGKPQTITQAAASAFPWAWQLDQNADPGAAPGSGFSSVSCVNAAFCAAVDFHGKAFEWDGQVWSKTKTAFPGGSLSSISCIQTSFCAAVGNGDFVAWAGTTWSKPQQIDVHGGLNAISCQQTGTKRVCEAVDNTGNVLTWRGSGTGWSLPQLVDTGGGLSAISCPTATFCMAVDVNGHAFAGNGTLTALGAIGPGTTGGVMRALSCPSARFCIAISGDGTGYQWHGAAKWFKGHIVDGLGFVEAVSCATAWSCVSVDAGGNAAHWNGKSWSSLFQLDPLSDGGPDAVSCARASFCSTVSNGATAIVAGS